MSSVAASIKRGLQEAIEIEAGTRQPSRVDCIVCSPPPRYTAREIKSIRADLKMPQWSFALLIGVSVKTVEAWETGTNRISGSAARTVQLFTLKPELLHEFYEKSNSSN